MIVLLPLVVSLLLPLLLWKDGKGELEKRRSQPSLSLESLDADALLMFFASLVTTAAAAAGVDVVVDTG